jgi:hypothetical protein
MRRNKGRFCQARDVPKAFLGDVRQVDKNLHLVACLDESFAGICQAIADIRAGGKVEWDTVTE